MTLIVDASVALKWVLEEDGSDAARALVADEALAAPDLLFIECANVLWVKARRGNLSIGDAKAAYAAIEAVPIRAISTYLHAAAAQSIAFDLDRTPYDSLYLAVAMAENATLVSADAVFVKAASAHPLYRNSVRLL
ncbi:MAG: PIN domain-containing protein [Alphaproteobacteria bacterium]|nr:PIN domain-containing protein [Alphaproteobacteria bacterium]